MTTAAFIPVDMLASATTKKKTTNVVHIEDAKQTLQYRAFYPPTVGETDLGLFQFTTSSDGSRS
jgi:hypothetical protein